MVSTLRRHRVYERVRKPIGMIMGGILVLAGNQAGDRVKLPSPKAALAMAPPLLVDGIRSVSAIRFRNRQAALEAVFELVLGHGMSENRSVSGAKTCGKGCPLTSDFATPKWTIFAISLATRGGFSCLKGVKSRLWSANSTTRSFPVLDKKIRLVARVRNPIQRQP